MEYVAAIIFFFGKLFHPWPVFEIALGLLTLLNLRNFKKINNPYFLIFIIYTLITGRFYNYSSFLYWLRLTCLLSFFVIPPVFSQKYKHFFLLIVSANLIFGLIQYFIWPNFTYFNALNWDPHLFRLISTFLDPTFTGLLYLMFLIVLFCHKLPFYYLILPYVTMSLTYSRSSLLAFLASFAYLAKKLNKPKIFYISSLLLLITLVALPRREGEGTKLERLSSVRAKIENYQEGITLFKQHPILGVGYNNLKHVRNLDNNLSHSSSGFDGSLLTILTTTGLIGFSFFILGWYHYFRQTDLLHQTLLAAIFIHSLFSNSLLYPFVLFFLISV
ncbi:MAG TPA: O-antigen ligase family protein [Candidatus Woesebacteria bacterium]|nr:O-antigen ligase family protein [Candidatus Woesebacteria bacterium]